MCFDVCRKKIGTLYSILFAVWKNNNLYVSMHYSILKREYLSIVYSGFWNTIQTTNVSIL